MVLSMQGCMLGEMLWGEEEEIFFTKSFLVFYVKFPCACALHFCLYPEVAKGMNMMKLANNQSDQFVPNGDKIAYFIGFIQVFTALVAEYINITLLSMQQSVERCIIHFVALEVIMEVAGLYFESLMGFKIKGIMHHPPKLVKRSKDIQFTSRSCFHQCARLFYKILRCLYVSLIFYYIPFAVVVKQWNQPAAGAEEGAEI